jgi:multiple sugar transport system permease protein
MTLTLKPRRRAKPRASTIIVTGVLVIVALYFLIPLYWVFVAASKSTEDLFSTYGFWFAPTFSLWNNLQQVLTYDGGIFVRWFLNSVVYAGVGAVIATYFARRPVSTVPASSASSTRWDCAS